MEQDPSPAVVALVKDLFFSVKLRKEIQRAGFSPRIVTSLPEFIAGLRELAPVLGVIDLGAHHDLTALGPLANDARTAVIPIIAFGPHKDVEAFQAAKAAGITRVMSNSLFHAQTADMIRRYARAGERD